METTPMTSCCGTVTYNTSNAPQNFNQKAIDSPDEEPSFYRRPLPSSTCIDFASSLGKKLFKESLLKGTMECYFSLASNFVTQNEPATCGLGTMCMVLNSLELDPDRIWKGPWRWYSEEMLDCCSPMETVRKEGITVDDFACEARCNGADVTLVRVYRPSNETLQIDYDKFPEWDHDTVPSPRKYLPQEWEPIVSGFRNAVITSSRSNDTKLVVSYSRSALLQTGIGHYSPIGGYHEESDSVLILDVARFKYPPHWVPLELLVASMAENDSVTGLPRGYFLITPSRANKSTVLRITAGRSKWKQLADAYRVKIDAKAKLSPPKSIGEYVHLACKVIHEVQTMDFLVGYVDSMQTLAPEHLSYIHTVFDELHETLLFKAMVGIPSPCCKYFSKPGYLEIAALFIMAQGPHGTTFMEPAVAEEVVQILRESKKATLVSQETTALEATLRVIQRNCLCRAQAVNDPDNEKRGCRRSVSDNSNPTL